MATHASTVSPASPRGSCGPRASVRRAHASRECLIFMVILGAALATPAIALPGFPLPLALRLSCRLLLPPASLASASPRPSLPPPRPGHPGLASLPRRRAPLRRGLGRGAGVPIQAGTVVPFFSPELGSTESVGAAEPPRLSLCLGARGPSGSPACGRARWDLVNGAGGGRHPCVRAGCAARWGARTRRVRPWTLRLWRPVPTISLSPGCFSSSTPAPPGCSLRLRRHQTGKGFLAPSPPAGAEGPTWLGGGGVG